MRTTASSACAALPIRASSRAPTPPDFSRAGGDAEQTDRTEAARAANADDRGCRLTVDFRRGDGHQPHRGRYGLERRVPVGAAQRERHLGGHAGGTVPKTVLDQEAPVQCPSRARFGAGPGSPEHDGLRAVAPHDLARRSSSFRAAAGAFATTEDDMFRVAVVFHQCGQTLLLGARRLDAQGHQHAAQFVGGRARSSFSSGASSPRGASHACRRGPAMRSIPVAVRPDQCLIGQRLQRDVQFAGGFVVRYPQQLRQSVPRRAALPAPPAPRPPGGMAERVVAGPVPLIPGAGDGPPALPPSAAPEGTWRLSVLRARVPGACRRDCSAMSPALIGTSWGCTSSGRGVAVGREARRRVSRMAYLRGRRVPHPGKFLPAGVGGLRPAPTAAPRGPTGAHRQDPGRRQPPRGLPQGSVGVRHMTGSVTRRGTWKRAPDCSMKCPECRSSVQPKMVDSDGFRLRVPPRPVHWLHVVLLSGVEGEHCLRSSIAPRYCQGTTRSHWQCRVAQDCRRPALCMSERNTRARSPAR